MHRPNLAAAENAVAEPADARPLDPCRAAGAAAQANGMPLDWLKGAESVEEERGVRGVAEAGELAKQDAERLAAGAATLARAGIQI